MNSNKEYELVTVVLLGNDIGSKRARDIHALILENLDSWKSFLEPYESEVDDDPPTIELTIGLPENFEGDEWGCQTGDNSFTGGAYSFPNWLVAYVGHDTKTSDILEQLISEARNF